MINIDHPSFNSDMALNRRSKRQKTKFGGISSGLLAQLPFMKPIMSSIDYNYFCNSISKNREPAPLRELTSVVSKLPAERITFGVGYPNANTFPVDEINVVLKNGTSFTLNDKSLQDALQYLPSVGYSPLIELLKKLQDTVHGKQPWEERDLLITTGSQEGLSKAADMCVQVGSPVIIQHPIYPGAADLFRPYRPDFILAEQDEYGVQPALLNKLLAKRLQEGKPMPKLMYVNPTAANPTGTTLTLDRRREIYQLACIYNFLILEDDAYYYLHFAKENPRSFLSLDTEGRVLRFDSFSKILSSGLRIGFITGPKPLLKRIELHIQVSTMHSSALSQVILYNILYQWGYEGLLSHLDNIKHFYRSKRDCMLEAAEKYLKDIAEWNEPTGGMFLWLRIKGLNNVRNLAMKKCIENLLVIAPGYVFCGDVKEPSSFIRLSYSAVTRPEIEKGMMLLSHAIREELSELKQ